MSQNVWKTAVILLSISQFTLAWNMVCYKGSVDYSETANASNAGDLVHSDAFNISLKTTIVWHGYKGSPSKPLMQDLFTALLSKGNINVCAFDWTTEASGLGPNVTVIDYPLVAQKALDIGKEMTGAIISMVDAGLNLQTTVCVGFSIGAHIIASVAKEIRAYGLEFFVVIGLDPAKQGFDDYQRLYNTRIDKTCARNVFIIHCNTDKYGMQAATGHQDWYPNGGKTQPGCGQSAATPFSEADLCSHSRCVRIYIEVICSPGCFIGSSDTSYCNWSESTTRNQVTTLIENTNKSYTGKFYFTTNSQSSYCKRQDGLKPPAGYSPFLCRV